MDEKLNIANRKVLFIVQLFILCILTGGLWKFLDVFHDDEGNILMSMELACLGAIVAIIFTAVILLLKYRKAGAAPVTSLEKEIKVSYESQENEDPLHMEEPGESAEESDEDNSVCYTKINDEEIEEVELEDEELEDEELEDEELDDAEEFDDIEEEIDEKELEEIDEEETKRSKREILQSIVSKIGVGIRDNKAVIGSALFRLLVVIIEAIYLVFVLEFVNNDLMKDIPVKYLLMNVAGILIIMFILLLIFNSYKWMTAIPLVFYTVITMVFYAVYLMRGEPFQFIDIFSVGTALEVVGNYKFVITYQIVTVVICSTCFLMLVLNMRELKISRHIIGKVVMRVAAIAICVGMFFYYTEYNWNGQVGITTDLFAPMKTYQECGIQVGFFCVAKYMRLTEPEGYSVSKTKEIAEQSLEEQVPNTITDVQPVNIICVMNESFADYRRIGDLMTNQEVMPFYDSLSENAIKGNTLVCIQGGGTAKSEYEFLTGNSVKRFPAMVPYVSYFTHDQYSLVTTLEAQGYESVVMHPYKRTNWNRPTAYRLLDFDEYISIEDMDEDIPKRRGLVSDWGNYQAIIDRVEQKENPEDKLFLFDITIQNHGGYTTEGFVGDIDVLDYDSDEVDQYLSLIHESDQALQYLIGYFSSCEEPTLVVMFGDHYPGLPKEFTEYLTGKPYDDLSIKKQEDFFAPPFVIWANYDIPEKTGVMTSTNFLGTMMLEQTGLEMAPYNYYLKNLMQDIPALNHLGYMDAFGEYHRWSDGDEASLDLEKKYEYLQYNNLVEKGKRLGWFFGMDGQK